MTVEENNKKKKKKSLFSSIFKVNKITDVRSLIEIDTTQIKLDTFTPFTGGPKKNDLMQSDKLSLPELRSNSILFYFSYLFVKPAQVIKNVVYYIHSSWKLRIKLLVLFALFFVLSMYLKTYISYYLPQIAFVALHISGITHFIEIILFSSLITLSLKKIGNLDYHFSFCFFIMCVKALLLNIQTVLSLLFVFFENNTIFMGLVILLIFLIKFWIIGRTFIKAYKCDWLETLVIIITVTISTSLISEQIIKMLTKI